MQLDNKNNIYINRLRRTNKSTEMNKVKVEETKQAEKSINLKEEGITKKEQGITLVALVITIIIIIILATVTINMAFGDNGLIKQAELARDLTANSTGYETQSTLNLVSYMNEMLKDSGTIAPVTNEIGGSEEPEEPDDPPTPEEPPKVEEIKGGEAFDKKTTIEDGKGNKIVVPAGLKIASDSGNTVQQGIVIEDVNASTDTAVQGSQFVWIPIGVFIKDGGQPSSEIILGRYTFTTASPGTPTLEQSAYTKNSDGSYTDNYTTLKVIESYYSEFATYQEGIVNNGFDGQNATAYDLRAWIESARENGGYYIGRYEASFASGTSIENYKAATKISEGNSTASMSYSEGTLWNFIRQVEASKVSINTYKDSKSVKSDLINSYAWDTAIVFIQECGITNYANQSSRNTKLSDTGTNNDEVCKINDMASNIREWTTEYSGFTSTSGDSYPCTDRGRNL